VGKDSGENGMIIAIAAETTGFYPDRTSGCHCHYRCSDGGIDAGVEQGQRTGQARGLS
jgi:hypothetical protein